MQGRVERRRRGCAGGRGRRKETRVLCENKARYFLFSLPLRSFLRTDAPPPSWEACAHPSIDGRVSGGRGRGRRARWRGVCGVGRRAGGPRTPPPSLAARCLPTRPPTTRHTFFLKVADRCALEKVVGGEGGGSIVFWGGGSPREREETKGRDRCSLCLPLLSHSPARGGGCATPPLPFSLFHPSLPNSPTQPPRPRRRPRPRAQRGWHPHPQRAAAGAGRGPPDSGGAGGSRPGPWVSGRVGESVGRGRCFSSFLCFRRFPHSPLAPSSRRRRRHLRRRRRRRLFLPTPML